MSMEETARHAQLMASAEAQADFDDALARAFAQIESAKKDKKGNFGAYSDLASVTEAIKGPLTAEGFSWPQTLDVEDGMVVVTTRLRRKGVELCSVLPMPVGPKGGAHAVGSAITYARRYALAALVGVAPEDDDGQKAQDSGGGAVRAPRGRQRFKPKAEQKPGGWRANASVDVLKADEVFRDLCKRRGALQRELEISREAMPNNPDRIVEILGREMPANPAEMPLDDWAQLNSGLRGDVEDLERTKLEKQAEEAAE